MERKNPFACYDCRGHAEPFMVSDAVWLRAWPTYRTLRAQLHREARLKVDPTGTLLLLDPEAFRTRLRKERTILRLCFRCLERRLGRRLTLADFPAHIPCNDSVHFGARLARRSLNERFFEPNRSLED